MSDMSDRSKARSCAGGQVDERGIDTIRIKMDSPICGNSVKFNG